MCSFKIEQYRRTARFVPESKVAQLENSVRKLIKGPEWVDLDGLVRRQGTKVTLASPPYWVGDLLKVFFLLVVISGLVYLKDPSQLLG